MFSFSPWFFRRQRPAPQRGKATAEVDWNEEEPYLGPERHTPQPLLPIKLHRTLVQTGWRALAVVFGLLAAGLTLARLTYNSLDPSWNTATVLPATNVLGRIGALLADLLVQGIGLLTWYLIATLALTAVRTWRTLSLPTPLRRLGWFALSVLLWSLGLAELVPWWPMIAGVVGFLFASFVPAWLGVVVGPLALLGALGATARGLRLTWQEITAEIRSLAQVRQQVSIAKLSPGFPKKTNMWSWVTGLVSRRSGSAGEAPQQPDAIPRFLVPVDPAPVPTPPHEVSAMPPADAKFAPQSIDASGSSPLYEVDLDLPPSLAPLGVQTSEIAPGDSEGPLAPDPSVSEPTPKQDVAGIPNPDPSDEFVRESPAFVATPEGEVEEIDLIIQRPSTKLVETAQMSRQTRGPAAANAQQATMEAGVRATATYAPPPLSLLYQPTPRDRAAAMTQEEANATARSLEATLKDYGVKGEITRVLPGPVVTLYELEPAPGIKTSRVVGLADDIARSMAALSARIAPVRGRSVIGIELPNPKRETVFLHELLADGSFSGSGAALPLALGKDIGGQAVMGDLAKMPHLLVAGTTGSGKSVAVNTMILSLVYALSPEQVRFIMIDPKILELSVYDGIPHLLSPVVTDPKKAVVALKWVVQEMNQRYESMSTLNVRNIANYNAKIKSALKNGETLRRQVQVGFDPDTGEPLVEDQAFDTRPLPHIVVIVDEMAELMLMVGKDIEAAIQSIAQKARAAGIHMIMATQRPSVDVITGTIKANFPSRISFAVSSKIDSRTVLNEMGAEQLLGQGDMLYQPNGGLTTRVHGPFASDEEVEAVVQHLRSVGTPDYVEAIGDEEAMDAAMGSDGLDMPLFEKDSSGDDLYDRAVQVVLRDKKASTSHVQRRLQIGYNRAANLIDRMEQEGLISSADHVGRRKIMVPGDSASDGETPN